MRAILARLALVLGVFALAASAVAIFWGHDAARRIPLNTDSYTRLTGTASGLLTKSEGTVPVTYITHTQVDPNASNGDVIAIQQTSCVATTTEYCIDAKGNFVLAATDDAVVNIGLNKFALDRNGSLAVKDQAKWIKDTSEVKPYEGVVIKFPFGVEKKSYPYWDGTLGKAVTATYAGTRTIDGLETYKFTVDIPATDAEIAEGTEGTYAATQTIYVDPTTGAFIDQSGTQTVALPDGTSVLDIDVTYTDATIKANVDQAKDNGRSLWLVDVVVRWGGLVLGIALIALAVFLLRRPKADATPAKRERVLTHA
ncbi:MAG: DUF3068 domain-containing protein [Nocardioides sp.]|uniref:DUF3068 domain-containing protein n=1 Tax=Nocardioides sp. TaxID=35761 RepID=UPI0039E5E245